MVQVHRPEDQAEGAVSDGWTEDGGDDDDGFRQLAEKVERFARREAELAEKGESVLPVIYPDPGVPYEERCIM